MKNFLKKISEFSRTNSTWSILIFITALSLIASGYFFSTDQILLYNDARSHMDIARRVTDSLTPGLMQFGSVWLPLYHMLMLPFVQSDFLWKSGLAGTIVSSAAYIAACYFIFKTLNLTTKSALVSIFGFLLFALNPNLLYLQSVPLDEVLAVSTAIASIYYVLKWSKTDYVPDLVVGAFFALLGSLSRYEVWFLVFAEIVFVFVASLNGQNLKEKLRKAEGFVILFGFLAFSGIGLWFLYNLLGWSDPLYFLNDPSAHLAQQGKFEENGLLPTKHNLPFSALVLLSNIAENVGGVLTAVTVFGLGFLLISKNQIKEKVFYLLTLAPLGFLLLSLFFGITVLFTKFFPAPGTSDKVFNVRYGIIALIPAVIISATFLATLLRNSKTKFISYILMAVLVIGDILFFVKTGTPATIQDGQSGISGFGQAYEVQMSQIVKDNCKDGLTLISAGQDEIIMFESGFPMKQFIYEGSGKYWDNALVNPQENAICIVVQKNGIVENAIDAKNSSWRDSYKELFNANNSTFIYKLKSAGDSSRGIEIPKIFESSQITQVQEDSGMPVFTVVNGLEKDQMFWVTVQKGDSLSRLYRRAVESYSREKGIEISSQEKLFMENYLVLNLPKFSLRTGDKLRISGRELTLALEEAKRN